MTGYMIVESTHTLVEFSTELHGIQRKKRKERKKGRKERKHRKNLKKKKKKNERKQKKKHYALAY